MSKQNVQIVKNFFEGASKGDMSAVRSLLDPYIEWIEPGVKGLWFGGVHRGAEAALKEVIEPTFDNIDDFSIRIDEYLDAGNEIVALGKFHGRGKATRKELDIPACFVCSVRNGKIARFRAYHNTALWLEVMGQPVA